MSNNGWTPTERKLVEVLQDGGDHSKQELLSVLDPYTEDSALQMHLSRIRGKLKNATPPVDLVCVSHGRRRRYRLVHPYKPYSRPEK